MSEVALAACLLGYANRARYEFRGKFLFDGITLKGSRFLEVGAGTGAWAIWAALHGASEIVGIEPEGSGSRSGALSIFQRNLQIPTSKTEYKLSAVLLRIFPRSVL